MTANNRMQRSGHDKVHAPHWHRWLKVSDYAPQDWRAVADAGRWATLQCWLLELRGPIVKLVSRFRLWTVIVASLAVCGCEPDLRNIKTSSGRPCEEFLDGAMQFMGDGECFKAFPKKTFSGYWVTGLEHSVFYKDLTSIPDKEGPETVWLDFSSEAYSKVNPLTNGGRQVFEVSFIGRDPGRTGFFGHFGMYKRGIRADQVLTIKEVGEASSK